MGLWLTRLRAFPALQRPELLTKDFNLPFVMIFLQLGVFEDVQHAFHVFESSRQRVDNLPHLVDGLANGGVLVLLMLRLRRR